MSTWKTDVQRVVNNVGNTFNTVSNTVQDTFGNVANRAISDVTGFFQNGTTVVGINAQQIPAMKEAIRGYVNGIQSALGELVNYNPEVAFKGEHVAELRKYIDAMINVCNAIVSNMLAFNDELSKVYAAYQAKEQASASAISSDASSRSSQYTAYQEQTN